MINWRAPLIKSILLHLLVVALILLGGLSLFSRKPDEVFVPIMVEILNVTDKNNIPKAQVAASKPKPKPTPPKPKPTPPKPKPKVEPKPAEKPEVKPTEKPKEKPVEKPKEEPKKDKPKEQVDELDQLLKSLEEEESEQPDMAQTQEEFDPSQPLSVSETNAILGLITRQIQKCWNVPAGARNAADLVVLVDVDIAKDGTLKFVDFVQGGNYDSNDEFYRVAADSARRAILDPRCNPLRQLPPADKYDFWGELTLGFDPKQQIY